MNSELSFNQAIRDFLRTNRTNQLHGTLFYNGITYQKFMEGFYINGYDLTTNGDGGMEVKYENLIVINVIKLKISSTDKINFLGFFYTGNSSGPIDCSHKF